MAAKGKVRTLPLCALLLLLAGAGLLSASLHLLAPHLRHGSWMAAALRRRGARALLRGILGGAALPVLAQDAFPGRYQLCPHWKSKDSDKNVTMDSGYPWWDVLFNSSARFLELTEGKSCAVVGSSGILQASSFGAEISAHGTVVRFGLADIVNTTMVGDRTDVLWVNPSTVDKVSGRDMAAHRVRLIMVSAQVSKHYDKIRAMKKRVPPGMDVEAGPLDCAFYREVRSMTKELVGRVPTSGLLSVVWALRFCKSVDLYGVWPFSKDCTGTRNVPYHYFDSWTPVTASHDGKLELNLYRDLQRVADGLGIDFRIHLPENAMCADVPGEMY